MSSDPKPVAKPHRRRFFQLSLRTFLVAVIGMGASLGWYIKRAESQKRAVNKVVESGGTVNYAFQYDSNGIFDNTLRLPFPEFFTKWVGIDYLSNPHYIWVTNQDGIDAIQGLPSIARLFVVCDETIDLTPLSDVRIVGLALWCGATEIDGMGVHVELETLSVRRIYIDLETASQQFPNLKYLDLSECPLPIDFAKLNSLKQLKSIRLTNMGLCDREIKDIQSLLPNCKVFPGEFIE